METEIISIDKDKYAYYYMEQIKYLSNEAISIQNTFVSFTYIPMAFLGVLIYYAYQNGVESEIFLILPFLIGFMIFNLLKYTMKILGIDAYIKILEERINKIYDKSLFNWQKELISSNKYSVWGFLGQAPGIFACYIFVSYDFIKCFLQTPNSFLSISMVVLFVFQTVLLAIMGIKTSKHYNIVLEKANNIIEL